MSALTMIWCLRSSNDWDEPDEPRKPSESLALPVIRSFPADAQGAQEVFGTLLLSV